MRSKTRLLVASVRSAEQVGDLAARSAFLFLSLARALAISFLPTPLFLPPSLTPLLPYTLFFPPSLPPFLPASLLPSFPLPLGLSLSLSLSRALSLSLAYSLSRARSLYLPLCFSLSPKHAQTHMHTSQRKCAWATDAQRRCRGCTI